MRETVETAYGPQSEAEYQLGQEQIRESEERHDRELVAVARIDKRVRRLVAHERHQPWAKRLMHDLAEARSAQRQGWHEVTLSDGKRGLSRPLGEGGYLVATLGDDGGVPKQGFPAYLTIHQHGRFSGDYLWVKRFSFDAASSWALGLASKAVAL